MSEMNGFLLVDKPKGVSSFGVVGRVRKLLGVRKAGHCGTLDPLATGLLIVCLGKATKLSRFVMGDRKSYETTITLGATTDTYDREGALSKCNERIIPTRDEIEAALGRFTGIIKQTPPLYSALKVKGKPLYKYARKSENIEIEPREVLIESISLTNYDYPIVKLSITCGAGTYIRSLAHDLGQVLGCGGYVEQLRRVRIGEIHVANAVGLDELEKTIESTSSPNDFRRRIGGAFVRTGEMVKLPALVIERSRLSNVEHGVPLRADDISGCDSDVAANQLVALRTHSGDLLAIGRTLYPTRLLRQNPDEQIIEYVRVI